MGGQKGIAFFNRYLGRQLSLTCITTKNNKPQAAEPYAIRKILSNSALRYINPFYFFTLKRIIREEQITHLLIEHPYYAWLGILLKWFCKVKLVVHSHNIESLRFKTMGKWWWGILWHYEKLAYRKADHNFFIHEDDRKYAVSFFKLNQQKCTVITYGFELSEAPTAAVLLAAKEELQSLYTIPKEDKILLFNGTLGYKPNLDALDIILDRINPLLLASPDLKYKIIICGNKLPEHYHNLAAYKEKNIIYAGFVNDINLYFKGATIFINPVIDGGGIKTKVVEALGYDLAVISTQSGAIGIPENITNGKLKVLPDNAWEAFANEIIAFVPGEVIPAAYFQHFYWNNIAAKAAEVIYTL